MQQVKPRLSPRSAAYWRAALAELHNLRSLVFAALIVALSIVVSAFYIPVADNLRIYFKFLVTAAGSAVYGPVMAALVGAAADTLGFFIHPSGGYFPGYLLSEVLGNVIFALLLYRRRITVLRLFLARALIDFGVNVALGSLWSAMLYSKGYVFYAGASLVKNSLLLVPEVLLLALLFSMLLPVLTRQNAVPPQERGRFLPRIPWI